MKKINPLEIYNRAPYYSQHYPDTHPKNLKSIVDLYGLQAPKLNNCSILELGCAAGENIIQISQDLPQSECIGIDFSSTQIELGQNRIKELKLSNLKLEKKDLLEINKSFGEFDYIIAHGVFSWIPPHLQDKLLQICSVNLKPQGIALVSYNTFPGWHVRKIIHDFLTKLVEKEEDLYRWQTNAIHCLKDLMQKLDDNSLKQGIQEILAEIDYIMKDGKHQTYVLHQYLEPDNHPIFFQDFIKKAQAEKLKFVCEADYNAPAEKMFPDFINFQSDDKLDSRIKKEQYWDFIVNRNFRQTILCHQKLQLKKSTDPVFDILQQLYPNLIKK